MVTFNFLVHSCCFVFWNLNIGNFEIVLRLQLSYLDKFKISTVKILWIILSVGKHIIQSYCFTFAIVKIFNA